MPCCPPSWSTGCASTFWRRYPMPLANGFGNGSSLPTDPTPTLSRDSRATSTCRRPSSSARPQSVRAAAISKPVSPHTLRHSVSIALAVLSYPFIQHSVGKKLCSGAFQQMVYSTRPSAAGENSLAAPAGKRNALGLKSLTGIF